MVKLFMFILSLAVIVEAQNIVLSEAPPIKKRVVPISQDTIASYSQVLKKTMACVVEVITIKRDEPKGEVEDFLNGFFPYDKEFSSKNKMVGSGVVVSDDGYVVTSNHLVNGMDKIVIKLSNSSKNYKAKLIVMQEKMDLALIKIDSQDQFTPILFANSSRVKVGDVVFAIGNQFGRGQCVTQGIVSAKYKDYIQTDATMNPGSSGGALVDSRGALFGISSMIFSNNGQNNGMGFCLEVDAVRAFIETAMKDKN